MKLLGLKTTNFKKLVAFEIQFTNGLNVIIGDNAAGKSTLLQACITALYGQSVIPGKKEDIPTWGQKNFSVCLTFEHEGKTYRATRDIRNAKIENVETGELVASGNSTCTKFVEDLVGLQFKDFALFVLSQQGETAGVLTFGATALQKRVEAFSGAEVIDTVLTKVRSQANVLNAQLDGREAEDPQPLVGQLDVCQLELVGVNARLLDTSKSLEQIKDKLHNELRQKLDTGISLQRSYERLASASERAKDALVRTTEALERISEVKVKLPEMGAPVTQIEDAIHDEETALDRSVKYTNKVSRLKSSVELMQGTVDGLRERAQKEAEDLAKYNELLPNYEALQSQLNGHEVDLREARSELIKAQQEAKDGICSACNRPLEDHDPAKAEGRIRHAKNLLEVGESSKQVTEKELSNLKAQIQPVSYAVSKPNAKRLAEAESELDELEQQLAVKLAEDPVEDPEVIRSRLDDLKTDLAEARAQDRERRRISAEYTAAEHEVKTCEQRHAEAMVKWSDVAKQVSDVFGDKDIQKVIDTELKPEIAKLEQEEEQLRSDEKALTEDKHRLQRDEAQLTAQIESIHRNNKEVKQFAADLDKHKRLITFLVEARQTYLKRVWDQILGVASHKVKISTAGTITRVARDNNGGFVAEEQGKWVPVANCSGAQKGHIGVALRVGLAASLYGNSALLVLDEPTDAMNETNSMQLAGSLMGLGGQCVMITHRPFEQLSANNVIQVGA